MPLAAFAERMEALIAEIKGVPLAEGFSEVFYPGEQEAHMEPQSRLTGIALPAATVADLNSLAPEYTLPAL